MRGESRASSPEYLTNVGSILCKLGRTDPSPQWLERWKSDNIPRLAPTELYELLDHDLPAELRQAIQDEMDKRAGPSDMPSILRRLLTGATGRNDLKNLATVSETDFYRWMASSKDDDVISTIRHLLETLSVATEPEATIRKKIITALKRIELTDVANKIRVSSLMRKFEDTAKMSPDGNQIRT